MVATANKMRTWSNFRAGAVTRTCRSLKRESWEKSTFGGPPAAV